MSGGGFFRGTSADQDTRFSNKQAKLLKTQKFPPELDHLVDMTKVKLDVIRPWIANRTTEILGFEDEVLINLIYGHLDGKEVDGKQIQIQITGFLEKNTGKFMKELWNLLLSAQQNASGIPQQFLDAKAEQLRKKQADKDRVESELKKVEELSREREQAKDSKIVADLEAVKTTTKDPENSNLSSKKDLLSPEKSTAERRWSSLPRRKNEDSKISHRGNHDADGSSRSRSRSHSYAPSRSRSRSPLLARRRRSRSTSRPRYRHRETSPAARRRRRRRSPLGSPVRRKHASPYGRSPRRRSPSPRRRRPSSPPRRRSPSSSPSPPPPFARRRRSPSPALRRLRRSRSPAVAIAMRRRSRSPLIPSRRRSPSPLHALKRRRSPSPPLPMRRRSPSPSLPMRRRSSPSSPPLRRHRSPPSLPPVRRHRSSPSPSPSPSPSLRHTSPPHSPPAPVMRLPPSPSLNKRYYSPSHSPCVSRSPSPVSRQKLSPFGKRHSPFPSPSPSLSPRHHELSPGSFPRNDVDPQSPSNHRKSTHGRRQSRMHDSQDTSKEDGDSLESPAERRKYSELSKGKNTEATYVSERIEHGSRKTDTSKGVGSAYKNQHPHEISEPRRKSSHSQNIVDYSRKNAVGGPASEDVEYGPGRLVHGTHLADEPNNGVTVKRHKMSSTQVENESNDLVKPRKSLSNKRHANDLMNSVDDKSKMKHHIHSGSDSDVEENRENRRKHSKKRKSRRDEDDESMSSEERREAKRKRKEEKRLRREEKRRHREEKHRRREERRARRSKAKVGPERDMEPEKDCSSEEQMQHDHKEVESYHKSNDEVEDEQRRLEIELRRKALESLRAKKGISH